MTPPDTTTPPHPHGTLGGYTNHRCRCAHCRRAWAAYMAAWGIRQRQAGIPPEHPAHGTTGGYNNHGCRCARCATAWRDYQRDYQRDYRANRHLNRTRA